MDNLIVKIKENMGNKNKYLSPFATKDESFVRLKKQDDFLDIRPPFFKDTDSIIHSLSYTRYIDKTQVFSNIRNDNITKRVLHVQLVNKIARTIGRALNLNEDLIEAISLGHDIGHTPFGHVGEAILNRISLENNEGYFMHNVQSVRNFLFIEKNGKGMNLSIQVLDGILCHNGEILSGIYAPIEKDSNKLLDEYYDCYKDEKNSLKLAPMTLEGCVVRISDVIAYIGRDLEDGIRLGLISKDDIPNDVATILGNNNSDIINTIVIDIIKNSLNKNYIKMSEDVFDALNKLKDFNFKNIYYKANSKKDLENYEKMFRELFNFYLDDLNSNCTSDLYTTYLIHMNDKYRRNNTDERIVIDYIAGMTDNYFMRKYNENIKECVK